MRSISNILVLLVAISGILIGSWVGVNSLWWLLIFLALVTGVLLFAVLNRRRSGWLMLMAIFCLSGFWYSKTHEQYRFLLHINQTYPDQWVTVTGVQIQRTEATLHGVKFLLQTGSAVKRGPCGKFMVYYRGKLSSDTFGRKLQIHCKFKENLPGNPRFPDYLEQQGITGNLFAGEGQVLIKGNGLPPPYLWAEQIRNMMMQSGKKVLQPVNARLLHGMIFNDSLSSEVSDRKLINELRRTGTIHLISVSGLHVGFLVIGLTWLLGFLRISKKLQIIPLIFGVCFYIMMTGMGPPVLRAGIMMMVYGIGNLIGADTKDQVGRLALAAVLLLFWNPYYLFQVSFQLSFIATLGVVWLYPVLKEYFSIRQGFMKPVWDAVLVSLGAQIMVTPVIIHYFQQISWISPLANLLFFLPSELIIMGGLAGESLALILPMVARWILIAVDGNLTAIRWIAHVLASPGWAASWSPDWPWPWIIAYYIALILILDLLQPNFLTKKRMLNTVWITLGVLGLLNFVIWAAFFQVRQGRYLELTAIDVGQGDSLFIRSPDGINLLIDGGDEGKGIAKVIPFLRSNGIERLNLVIATHGDRDHIGGLAEVLEEVPAEKLFLPVNSNRPAVQKFLRRIRPGHILCEKVFSGEKFRLGTEVYGEILDAPGMDDENDCSLVTLLKYGKNKLLLTGDLSNQGEAIFSRKYPALLRASVLKVGHHGSGYASTLAFISQAKPKVGIISVGAGNHFGHPSPATINRLHSLGIHIYRTDRQGQITVKLYGKAFTVTTYKN